MKELARARTHAGVPRRGQAALGALRGGLARLPGGRAVRRAALPIGALALVATAVAGSMAALAPSGSAGHLGIGGPEPSLPARAASPNVAATQTGVAARLAPPPALPPARASLAATPRASATEGATPAATRTPAPAEATPAAPDASDAWQALQPELDASWDSDWPLTVSLLAGFRQRFPDYEPARSKLYAALLAYGTKRREVGDSAGAGEAFAQAAALLPDRDEAAAALAALTPIATSTPLAPAPTGRTVTPLRRPVPPPAEPLEPAPAPTPTKAPFVPP